MRNIVLASAIVALATPAFVPPAFAQMGGVPNVLADSVKLKTEDEVLAEQAREKGFKEGLGKIPNAQGKKDPWGNVRSDSTAAANQPKAAAPSKPKSSASNQPKPNTK
jgi:hypothetical protein